MLPTGGSSWRPGTTHASSASRVNEDDEKRPPSSVLELKKRIRRADAVLNPSSFMVAGARNHLQANRSLGFCFEILI
jgi:hypothetical protein